jgi:hypothetical protein
VIAPNGTVFFSSGSNNANSYLGTQPDSITLDDFGDWEIQTKVQSFRLDKIIGVGNIPTANAGTDQTVNEGVEVTLDGTGSSDSDGTIASYAWTQTGGKPVTLSDNTADQPTFTKYINGPTSENLTFSLTVTDNHGLASTADEVIITVDDAAVANQTPQVANPIADIVVNGNPDDIVIDLTSVFDDPEDLDSVLVYSLVSNNCACTLDYLIFDNDADTLTIGFLTGGDNNGQGDITIRATDSSSASIDDVFNIDDN